MVTSTYECRNQYFELVLNPLRRIGHAGTNAWIKHRARWTKDDFRRSIMMNQKPAYVNNSKTNAVMHLYENPEVVVPKFL